MRGSARTSRIEPVGSSRAISCCKSSPSSSPSSAMPSRIRKRFLPGSSAPWALRPCSRPFWCRSGNRARWCPSCSLQAMFASAPCASGCLSSAACSRQRRFSVWRALRSILRAWPPVWPCWRHSWSSACRGGFALWPPRTFWVRPSRKRAEDESAAGRNSSPAW